MWGGGEISRRGRETQPAGARSSRSLAQPFSTRVRGGAVAIEWSCHCASAASGDTLEVRSLVTPESSFDRQLTCRADSIEPLNAQQLPGAAGRAPRGTKNGGRAL